jgi:hypothetical protein
MTENSRRAAVSQHPRHSRIAMTQPTTPAPGADWDHGAVSVTPLSTHDDLILSEPVVRRWPLGREVLLDDRGRGSAGIGATSRSRLRQHRYGVIVRLRVSSDGTSSTKVMSLLRLCESARGHRRDSCPIGQVPLPARPYERARKPKAWTSVSTRIIRRCVPDSPTTQASGGTNLPSERLRA